MQKTPHTFTMGTYSGTVHQWDKRGYGRIHCDEFHQLLFCHQMMFGGGNLIKGRRVVFDAYKDPTGNKWKAVNITGPAIIAGRVRTIEELEAKRLELDTVARDGRREEVTIRHMREARRRFKQEHARELREQASKNMWINDKPRGRSFSRDRKERDDGDRSRRRDRSRSRSRRGRRDRSRSRSRDRRERSRSRDRRDRSRDRKRSRSRDRKERSRSRDRRDRSRDRRDRRDRSRSRSRDRRDRSRDRRDRRERRDRSRSRRR